MRTKQVKFASEEAIGDDLPWLRMQFCFLRVLDYSYSSISDILNVQKSVVLKWKDDKENVKQIDTLRKNMVQAAIERGQSHAMQMMEMLARIAAGNEHADPAIAIKAAVELLDRVGATKVNKSERHVVSESVEKKVEDSILDRMQKLPPDMQQAVASVWTELSSVLDNAEQMAAQESPDA